MTGSGLQIESGISLRGTNLTRVLLTTPDLKDKGGVANFYNSVLPHIKASRFKVAPLEIGSTKSLKSHLHFLKDQLRFRASLQIEPDLVHVNPSLDLKSFIRDGLFIWQAKRKGLPVLVFFHGWQQKFAQVVEKRLSWFFKRTFAQADGFIVLASEFKLKLRQWGITAPIYLGTTAVDNNLLVNFNLDAKLSRLKHAQEVKILFLARLVPAKGIFEIVDALKILLDKGLSVSLSIAGDGSSGTRLQEYVLALRIPKNVVRFLGYLRNKAKACAFSDHDIYCLPSYTEGLPNSLLEAMAFGMPILTRPVGGIKDLFIDGKMGFLTKSKSPEEIARLLEKIIQDKTKMIEMGRYNHEYAKNHFMASEVAILLEQIYASLSNNLFGK